MSEFFSEAEIAETKRVLDAALAEMAAISADLQAFCRETEAEADSAALARALTPTDADSAMWDQFCVETAAGLAELQRQYPPMTEADYDRLRAGL